MKIGFSGYYQRGEILATGEIFGYRPIIRRESFNSPLQGVIEDKNTISIAIATDDATRPLKRRALVKLEDGLTYLVANIIQDQLYSVFNKVRVWQLELVETVEK